MKAFTKLDGTVATLDRANVDTDQIIPKQFLKRIERSGFGQFLFYDWRFEEDGSDNMSFELNLPHRKGTSILVARDNFGSGSSREHAVWALEDFGIRCVIAPSFADIFFNNCFKNGVLPIRLSSEQVSQLFENAADKPYALSVDLESQSITDANGLRFEFDVDPVRKSNLLQGLDDIAQTLQFSDMISDYESKRGIVSN